ncbi:metallophosphoesterase family protein [Atopobiaceae bacterium 24-176]
MREIRVDIISDTHGLVTDELRSELSGANVIVHAGDITSSSDYALLKSIAPVHLCLGNNDYTGQYGPDIKRKMRFSIDGVRFELAHYRDKLTPAAADVCVFGHTHRPSIERAAEGGQVLRRRRYSTVEDRVSTTSLQEEGGIFARSSAVEEEPGAWLINPGSPTLPRTSLGPTMARLWIRDGLVEDPQIIQLPLSDAQATSPWFFMGM